MSSKGNSLKHVTTTDVYYERLQTLEFTSDRKRMSVIVRDPFGQIWLYTKGAESYVLPLCRSSPAQDALTGVTQTHIDEFARLGLRTLAVARRKLSADEYEQFCNEFGMAASSIANRKNLVDDVQAKMERGESDPSIPFGSRS